MIDGRLLVLAYPMMPPDACRHECSQQAPGSIGNCREQFVKLIMMAIIWPDPENLWAREMRLQLCQLYVTDRQGTKDVRRNFETLTIG